MTLADIRNKVKNDLNTTKMTKEETSTIEEAQATIRELRTILSNTVNQIRVIEAKTTSMVYCYEMAIKDLKAKIRELERLCFNHN
jgi:archaellum component FlaC